MEITSKTNNKVKQWMKYHQKKYRDQDEKFLVEGEHLIEEAIQALQLDTLLIRAGKANPFTFNSDVYEVSDEVMDKLSTNVSKVDYIGVCRKMMCCFSSFNRVLLLDNIQDPGNMGTIIRSAYSFGFQGIFISANCVDIYNEKCIRSTQGALFHVPIKKVDLKDQILFLKEKGYHVYATSLKEATPLQEVKPSDKCALIFGNEGQGVHQELIDISTSSIQIEMEAFESLNVAVAAGICMYYFRKK